VNAEYETTHSPIKRNNIMKRILSLATLAAFTLALVTGTADHVYAQGKPANKGFIDLNQDGIN